MSTEIEGPGGFQRGSAPRSESKIVACREQAHLDSTASRSGDRVNPFGRLLSYLSCGHKKDTHRRHQYLFLYKTH